MEYRLMPSKEKGLHPLGEKESSALPGSRLNKRKWSGVPLPPVKKVKVVTIPRTDRSATKIHGIVEVIPVRYHGVQKLTYKEHLPYSGFIKHVPTETEVMVLKPITYTAKKGIQVTELHETPALRYAKPNANETRIGGVNLSDNLIEGKSYLKTDRNTGKKVLVTQGPKKEVVESTKVDKRKARRAERKALKLAAA